MTFIYLFFSDDEPIADLFEKYLMVLGDGVFYLRPLAGLPIRYGNQVVGVDKLKKLVNMVKRQEKQKRVAAVLEPPSTFHQWRHEGKHTKKVKLETMCWHQWQGSALWKSTLLC